MTRERSDLRSRYLSLGAGELTAAAVFLWAAIRYGRPLDGSGRTALAAAVAPLLTLLVAAGVYWLLARSWVGVGVMPRPLARAYTVIGWGVAALLVAGLVGLLLWSPSPGWRLLLLVVWGFGVVELVNYYVRRLAFPPASWWSGVRAARTPRLVLDMRASRGHAAP